MRWPATKIPELGDTRTLRRFAWLPTRVGDRWIWLERYTVEEVYVCDWNGYVWLHRWLETDRRVDRS